jgi:hypothetical protein
MSAVGRNVAGGGEVATTTTTTTALRTMTTAATGVSSSDHGATSMPDELYPGEETEGEWEGCYLKFLSPISVGSRGVGEW